MPTYARLLPFEQAPNFRDLGGYLSRDGREISWKKIFRSSHLAGLTDRDQGLLRLLDIKQIHDFRRESERCDYPSRLPYGIETRVYNMGLANINVFQKDVSAGKNNAGFFHKIMVDGYRHFISEAATEVKSFIKQLAQPVEGAVLLHCMAGKDRTGLATALLLLLLDIPRGIILDDYMLTAKYFTAENVLKEMEIHLLGQGESLKDPEVLIPYCSVRPEYLHSAFDEIDSVHGGTDKYLARHLGISDTERDVLKKRFLTYGDI